MVNMKMNRYSLRAILVAATVFVAQSGLAELKVGDAAPELQVGQWLQGDAVAKFEGDKVYLIEFWATWCGPCKASIPHVNDFHERYKDKGLVVIGQDVLENDDSHVASFVQSMAGKMNYRVATDDKSDGGRGRMAQSWLAAADQNGIPCAFLVNKQGRLAYIGHPMSLDESLLEKLLAEPGTTAKADGSGGTAAVPSAKMLELSQRAETEIRAGNWDKAEATIADLQELLPENLHYLDGLLNLDLLLARKQTEDALQLTKVLCEDYKGNPPVLNAVAAHLAQQSNANAQLLAAAEKIATPVSAAVGGQQSPALATLARIAFVRGDRARAVELQTQAVRLATKGATARLQAALADYQQGRLPNP